MRITAVERAVIARRRLGLSQTEMARKLGTTLRQVALFEAGAESEVNLSLMKSRGVNAKDLVPSKGEKLYLARRRAGTSQREVAKAVGCCRRWVMLQEQGLIPPTKELASYWRGSL